MQVGYIGLGKMGLNMVRRLRAKGHRLSVHDPNPEAIKKARGSGVKAPGSVEGVVESLKGPRLIWIMVPHRFVDDVLKELEPHVKRGDTVIDGGNSPYQQSKTRAVRLAKRGIHFLDAGVSGGPKGARNGSCIMVGGKKNIFKRHEKLFRDLSVKKGYAYVGPSGAGHFVKMVHNGIEYGMMQSIAEGFSIMRRTPEYKLDMQQVAELFNHGSVIESRLVGWLAEAYKTFGNDLSAASGSAAASGEGLWTTQVAQRLGISDNVIHESLKARTRSQKKPNYQGKIIQSLRNRFGGHPLKPKKRKK